MMKFSPRNDHGNASIMVWVQVLCLNYPAVYFDSGHFRGDLAFSNINADVICADYINLSVWKSLKILS